MPAWFLNPALTRFRNEVNTRWPRRDKTSDGTIGDAAHQSRTSDHNPDPDGSVDAWDMDVDGPDITACKRVFEAHEASKYWIHNDQICFRDEGWRPRSYAYAGPNRNRHDHHVHWNSREQFENSTKPWFTEEEDMAVTENDVALIVGGVAKMLNQRFGVPVDTNKVNWGAVAEGASATQDGVAALVGRPQLEPQAIAEAFVTELGAQGDADIAAALKAVLGDRAAAVGALLAG